MNFIYLCLSAIINFNIDCTEFYCEAPTSLELKGNVYSDYKGRDTYKALVGITSH